MLYLTPPHSIPNSTLLHDSLRYSIANSAMHYVALRFSTLLHEPLRCSTANSTMLHASLRFWEFALSIGLMNAIFFGPIIPIVGIVLWNDLPYRYP
jgi:hypothetical protein